MTSIFVNCQHVNNFFAGSTRIELVQPGFGDLAPPRGPPIVCAPVWNRTRILRSSGGCLEPLSYSSVHCLGIEPSGHKVQLLYRQLSLHNRLPVVLLMYCCEGWNRTNILGFKGLFPTIRRLRNKEEFICRYIKSLSNLFLLCT